MFTIDDDVSKYSFDMTDNTDIDYAGIPVDESRDLSDLVFVKDNTYAMTGQQNETF